MSTDPSPSLIAPQALDLARKALGPRVRIAEIAGDASTRRFYRLTAGRKSVILMAHPSPLDRASPFYSNLRILQSIGAPVPKLLDRDDAAGLVLVEDLGDRTLQRHLLRGAKTSRGATVDAAPPAAGQAKRALYRRACDLIVLFQREGMKAAAPDDFACRHALDRDLFLTELRHFHRHFIGGLGRERPAAGDEAILEAFYDDLAAACGRLPRVYCHRDFQSRNLMVIDDRLVLIDFQDAREGPNTYDVASLLRDSSLDLEEELVGEMLAYLAGRLELPAEEFRRDFDLMALQRNIKDLGTFAYQATQRGRRDYLEHVPRTVGFIRNTLLRHRRYDVPYAVLERFILRYRA